MTRVAELKNVIFLLAFEASSCEYRHQFDVELTFNAEILQDAATLGSMEIGPNAELEVIGQETDIHGLCWSSDSE